MSVKEITEIDFHYKQARGRLHQFVKDIKATLTIDGNDFNGWEALIHAFVGPAQDLENVMFAMLNQRGLTTSEGVNLDRIGQIVGTTRAGLSDPLYLNQIYAQIFANNSNTAAQDLLAVTKAMSGADLVFLNIEEDFPAKVNINYLLETTITIDANNKNLQVRTASVGVPFTDYPSYIYADVGGTPSSLRWTISDSGYTFISTGSSKDDPYLIMDDATYMVANKFTPTVVGTELLRALPSFTRVGGFDADLKFSVQTTAAGLPTGVIIPAVVGLATATASSVDVFASGVFIAFPSPVPVSVGVEYALVMEFVNIVTLDVANYIDIETNSDAAPAGSGVAKFEGAIWVDGPATTYFPVLMFFGPVTLTFESYMAAAVGVPFNAELNANFKDGGFFKIVDRAVPSNEWKLTNPNPGLVHTLQVGNEEIDFDFTTLVVERNGSPSTPWEMDAYFPTYSETQKALFDSSNPDGLVSGEATPVYEPVIIPQGTFFPHELADLLATAIESAPSWLNPIVVLWDVVTRSYTLNISDSYPLGSVLMESFGPVIGFEDGEELTGVAISDSIPGPLLKDLVLLDALKQAKAVGVDLSITTQSIIDVFQFSNSVGGLGYASQLVQFLWDGYVNYVYPSFGSNPALVILQIGLDYALRIATPDANAAALAAEIDSFKDTGTGGFSYFAKNGDQVNYIGVYTYGGPSPGSPGISIITLNMSNGGVPFGTLYVNGGARELSTYVVDSGWLPADSVAFNLANPLGLGKGAATSPGTILGGGSYTKVLT